MGTINHHFCKLLEKISCPYILIFYRQKTKYFVHIFHCLQISFFYFLAVFLAHLFVGSMSKIMEVNESTYIPIGSIHKLTNNGKIPLEVVEIQVGEDDIIRYEDDFGRTEIL